jgi:hypothetical protein
MNKAARCQLKVSHFVVLLSAMSLPLISGFTTNARADKLNPIQPLSTSSAIPKPSPPETLADPNAPVSTALTGYEHDIPSGMAPEIGTKIYANGLFYLPNVRIVAFDGNRVLGEASGHRPGMPQTGTMGDLLATYTGNNVKFRAELSVNGSWTPISAP